jgi:predicted tellurium resistance membrane protein TerC
MYACYGYLSCYVHRFIMLFEYFKVPPAYQGRVLTWGIIGAISMRAIMILVGVAAIQKFRSVILVFAAILLASSIKLLVEKEVSQKQTYFCNAFVLRLSDMLRQLQSVSQQLACYSNVRSVRA